MTKPLGRNLRKFKNKRTGVTKANTIIYRASKVDCEPCPLKARCCPKEPARKIHRSIHEDARDVARALATTEDYAQSRNDRKKVEMLFAHLKKIMRFERLRLRGPTGAQDEFCLAAHRSESPKARQTGASARVGGTDSGLSAPQCRRPGPLSGPDRRRPLCPRPNRSQAGLESAHETAFFNNMGQLLPWARHYPRDLLQTSNPLQC